VYPSRTPAGAWALSTPTPLATALPSTDTLMVWDGRIISFTRALTGIRETADSYVPLITDQISPTLFALPVGIIRGLAQAFPFWLTGLAALLGVLLYRYVFMAILALVHQAGSVQNAAMAIFEMVAPLFENWWGVLAIAVLVLPIIVSQCNRLV